MLIETIFKRKIVSVIFVFYSIYLLYKRFQKFKFVQQVLNKKQNYFSICF